MSAEDNQSGAPTSPQEPAPAGAETPADATPDTPAESSVSYQPTVDDSYGYHDDPYGHENQPSAVTTVETPAAAGAAGPPPTPPEAPPEEEDRDDDGMLRMSFLEHLEELRRRLLYALFGIGVAFVVSLVFTQKLWELISQPAVTALTRLGVKEPKLAFLTPTEAFSIIWIKLPVLTAIFLASPWILYQVWGFIAPGLYRKERRWAAPFVISSAGLFILGGLFAYFVAFRYGLDFLLGIGISSNIVPVVSITEYFNLFVNVTLGIGLIFELPILIFFLTLLRMASPRWLLKNSRYAVLLIVVVAAIVTPTPDIVNLMLFSVPMCLLYFVGVFAGWLLVRYRERGSSPWPILFGILLGILALAAAGVYIAVTRYGYHLVLSWPFLVR